MSELGRGELIRRGNRAQELLEDPVYTEAMELTRDAFVKEWLATSDPQKQFAAWASIHAFDNGLELILRRFISDAQFAASQPEEE